jgi:hypothetical protein
MGISVMEQLNTQTSTYLGNRMLPGKTFTGAMNVTNKTPMKMTPTVSLKDISKNYQLATTFLLSMNISLNKKN